MPKFVRLYEKRTEAGVQHFRKMLYHFYFGYATIGYQNVMINLNCLITQIRKKYYNFLYNPHRP